LKIIISGYVDAIVGVACLNVLERALDKILRAGIPCMAIPLLSSDCRSTSVDEDWVQEMIHVRPGVSVVQTGTYLHLMRCADEMFRPAELQRLIPAQHGQQRDRHGPGRLDPVAATAALARRFLGRGGKHLRPFITLAAYDAATGGTGTRPGGPQHLATLPDAVRSTALSIETFHKASLVHDDIEDDDAYRYGVPTLHREYGIPTAINVGDYLIGLGYRLVSHQRRALGLETTADLLDRLAAAHMNLCEGQGAELSWRDARNKTLTPADALRIYALKTAPAFEVALYAGLRLAGPVDPYLDTIRQLARRLGIAFQILNDLYDWHGDADNKVRIGADVVGRRPTVLWAMSTESLGATGRQQLATLVTTHDRQIVRQVRQLYLDAGVFEKAQRLVDKYRARAEQLVEGMEPGPLQRLFRYLVETVLDQPTDSTQPGIPAPSSRGLPLVV
jgi:geranylgeranyl pyrophosphate synthase